MFTFSVRLDNIKEAQAALESIEGFIGNRGVSSIKLEQNDAGILSLVVTAEADTIVLSYDRETGLILKGDGEEVFFDATVESLFE